MKRVALSIIIVLIILIIPNTHAQEAPINIRVGIRDNDFAEFSHELVELVVNHKLNVKEKTTENIYSFEQGIISLTSAGDKIDLWQEGTLISSLDSPVHLYTSSEDMLEVISLKRGWDHSFHPKYRGILEISLLGEYLQLVNEISLEEYLYGVVPSEMVNTWPLEALKAQAVASRTYALRKILQNAYKEQDFYVDDSVYSQVYNNQQQTELTKQAVDDTQGIIMRHTTTGELIRAYFHSTSIGMTANSFEVWGDQSNNFPGQLIPYLQARVLAKSSDELDLSDEGDLRDFLNTLDIQSYDQYSPWFRWSVEFSKEELKNIITATLPNRYQVDPNFVLTKSSSGEFISQPISSPVLGELVSIQVIERGVSGNVMILEIVGTERIYRVKKELNIRMLLSPNGELTERGDIAIQQLAGESINYPILPSGFFVLDLESDSHGLTKVKISGGGNGHGVGMSQWAAKGMAEEGYSYETILAKFYRDVEFIQINDFCK